MSKEIHVQSNTRRQRIEMRPDRHYVMHELPSAKWDETAVLDQCMDEFDEHGEPAYTVEARGDSGEDQRYKVGTRRGIILSCSKEHYEKKIAEVARRSKEAATYVQPVGNDGGIETFERLEVQKAISVPEAVDKSQAAQEKLKAFKS